MSTHASGFWQHVLLYGLYWGKRYWKEVLFLLAIGGVILWL